MCSRGVTKELATTRILCEMQTVQDMHMKPDAGAEEPPDQLDAEVHDSRHGVHTGVTYYKVKVRSPQGEEWEVQRRYREFEQLKQHLSDEKIKITNFPGKRLWGR